MVERRVPVTFIRRRDGIDEVVPFMTLALEVEQNDEHFKSIMVKKGHLAHLTLGTLNDNGPEARAVAEFRNILYRCTVRYALFEGYMYAPKDGHGPNRLWQIAIRDTMGGLPYPVDVFDTQKRSSTWDKNGALQLWTAEHETGPKFRVVSRTVGRENGRRLYDRSQISAVTWNKLHLTEESQDLFETGPWVEILGNGGVARQQVPNAVEPPPDGEDAQAAPAAAGAVPGGDGSRAARGNDRNRSGVLVQGRAALRALVAAATSPTTRRTQARAAGLGTNHRSTAVHHRGTRRHGQSSRAIGAYEDAARAARGRHDSYEEVPPAGFQERSGSETTRPRASTVGTGTFGNDDDYNNEEEEEEEEDGNYGYGYGYDYEDATAAGAGTVATGRTHRASGEERTALGMRTWGRSPPSRAANRSGTRFSPPWSAVSSTNSSPVSATEHEHEPPMIEPSGGGGSGGGGIRGWIGGLMLSPIVVLRRGRTSSPVSSLASGFTSPGRPAGGAGLSPDGSEGSPVSAVAAAAAEPSGPIRRRTGPVQIAQDQDALSDQDRRGNEASRSRVPPAGTALFAAAAATDDDSAAPTDEYSLQAPTQGTGGGTTSPGMLSRASTASTKDLELWDHLDSSPNESVPPAGANDNGFDVPSGGTPPANRASQAEEDKIWLDEMIFLLENAPLERFPFNIHDVEKIRDFVIPVFKAEKGEGADVLCLESPVVVCAGLEGDMTVARNAVALLGEMKNFKVLVPGGYVHHYDPNPRGGQTIRLLLLLLLHKVRYPTSYFLLNDFSFSCKAFTSACKACFDDWKKAWSIFNEVFELMPHYVIVDKKYFCSYDGLLPGYVESIKFLSSDSAMTIRRQNRDGPPFDFDEEERYLEHVSNFLTKSNLSVVVQVAAPFKANHRKCTFLPDLESPTVVALKPSEYFEALGVDRGERRLSVLQLPRNSLLKRGPKHILFPGVRNGDNDTIGRCA